MRWAFGHQRSLRRRERIRCLSATNMPTTLVMQPPYTILERLTNLGASRSARFPHFIEQASQDCLWLDWFDQHGHVRVKRADHGRNRGRRMNDEGDVALGQHMSERRRVMIAQLAIENRRGDIKLFEQLK